MVSPKHRPNIQENTTRIPRFQNQNFRTVATFLCQYRSLQPFPRLPVFSRLYVTTIETSEVSRTRILPHCGFVRIFSLQYKDTGLLIKIFFCRKASVSSFCLFQGFKITSFLPKTRLEQSVSFFPNMCSLPVILLYVMKWL